MCGSKLSMSIYTLAVSTQCDSVCCLRGIWQRALKWCLMGGMMRICVSDLILIKAACTAEMNWHAHESHHF